MRLRLLQFILAGLLMVLMGCPGDNPKPPEGADQCLTCHFGIEPIHEVAFTNGQCVICHSGDKTAVTLESAHVPVPSNYWEIRGDALPAAPEGYIKDFTPDQLDALDPDYVRFINPDL